MKTCHKCGTMVDDKELVCPVCGATVVMSTEGSGLSLKSDEGVKLKSSPSMGRTLSTGSGLTDILRNEDDFSDLEEDTYVTGSMPMGFNSYDTEKEDEAYRRKKETNRVIKNIIRIVVLAAIAYGIYFVVTNFILVERYAKTCDDALKIYVEAVNDKDISKMKQIVAPYYSDPSSEAEAYLEDMKNVEFTSSRIESRQTMTSQQKNEILEKIQLVNNKAPYIMDACTVVVEFRGTVTSDSGNSVNKGCKVKMDFLEIDSKWYFYPDTYDNPTFTQ